MICKYCGSSKKSAHSLRAHESTCPSNSSRYVPDNRKGSRAWNSGLTKETSNVVRQYAETISKTRKGKPGKPHSEETRRKLSRIALEKGTGGQNCRKTFYYRGIALQSSYELAVAQSLDEHDIKWTRPPALKYDVGGKTRRYYPDFYLPEYDVYLDPKNDYLIVKDREKLELVCSQNSVRIYALPKSELTWEKIKGRLGVDGGTHLS